MEVKHECLSCEAVLLDRTGLWKVADPLTVGRLSNLDEAYGNISNPNIYLSPEQCWSIETQRPIQDKNAYKNDVFVFGMMLLQCGLLENQRQCYSLEFSHLKWDLLNQNISRFSQKYPQPELSQVLESMLSKDISSRPDWITLSQMTSNRQLSYRKSGAMKEMAVSK